MDPHLQRNNYQRGTEGSVILFAASEKAKMPQKDPISLLSQQNPRAALKAQQTTFLSKIQAFWKVLLLSSEISKLSFIFPI